MSPVTTPVTYPAFLAMSGWVMVRKERGPWSYALVVLACLGTVPVIFYQGQGVNPTSFHWTATNTERTLTLPPKTIPV